MTPFVHILKTQTSMEVIDYSPETSICNEFYTLLHIFPSEFKLDNLKNWIPFVMELEELEELVFSTNKSQKCSVVNINTYQICIIEHTGKKCKWIPLNVTYNGLRTEYTRWKIAAEKEDSSFCMRDDLGKLLPFQDHICSY